jgi:hypothetical protein
MRSRGEEQEQEYDCEDEHGCKEGFEWKGETKRKIKDKKMKVDEGYKNEFEK